MWTQNTVALCILASQEIFCGLPSLHREVGINMLLVLPQEGLFGDVRENEMECYCEKSLQIIKHYVTI